jgi:hypothetical protein
MKLARILLHASAAIFAMTAAAAELEPKTSSTAGVTVKVTPSAIAAGAAFWEFAVVLDTHSQTLDDDLLKSTVLLGRNGARHAPVSWEGAAPGGHHREGVLRFRALSPLPDAVELLVSRPGEEVPRVFRWTLK